MICSCVLLFGIGILNKMPIFGKQFSLGFISSEQNNFLLLVYNIYLAAKFLDFLYLFNVSPL